MKAYLCPRCGEYGDASDGTAIPIDDYAALVHEWCATACEIEAYLPGWGGECDCERCAEDPHAWVEDSSWAGER